MIQLLRLGGAQEAILIPPLLSVKQQDKFILIPAVHPLVGAAHRMALTLESGGLGMQVDVLSLIVLFKVIALLVIPIEPKIVLL